MTRIKEPVVGSTEIPDYKSPASRIVRSLRKGYDNLRKKLHERSATILDLREKLRDTQKSREEWRIRAKEAELSLKKNNTELKTEKKTKLKRD
jgi:exoribonuclease R